MTALGSDAAVYLAATVSAVLAAGAAGFTSVRLVVRGRFDLCDIFLLAFIAVYGVAYPFVLQATVAGHNPGGFRIIGHEALFWLVPALALAAALGGLCVHALAPTRTPRRIAPAAYADWTYPTRRDDTPLVLVFWLAVTFLAVALLASWLYTRAYGGIAGFFAVAGALRAGLFDEAAANPYTFLKPFGGFSLFASYAFAAVALGGPARLRKPALAGAVVSIVVSSVTLLGWGGRVDLLTYWITLAFGLLVYRMSLAPRLLGGLAALGVVMLIALPPVTDAMNPGKSRDSYVEFFAAELTFPAESSLNAIEPPALRWGADIVAAPLFVLPERIWGPLGVRGISDLNSEHLQGDVLYQGFGYTIPVDVITFGLFQFGLAGPLVVVVLWFVLLARLDDYLVLGVPRPLSAMLYAHAVFSIAALSVLYFDPKMQIARNFHFIAGLVSFAALTIGYRWLARIGLPRWQVR